MKLRTKRVSVMLHCYTASGGGLGGLVVQGCRASKEKAESESKAKRLNYRFPQKEILGDLPVLAPPPLSFPLRQTSG